MRCSVELAELRSTVAVLEAKLLEYEQTEQTQSRSVLQKNEAHKYQATALRNVSDAVITTDSDLRVRSWNAAAEAMYGWSADEVIGKPLSNIVPADYLNEATISSLKGPQDCIWTGEVIQNTKGGVTLNIMMSINVIRDESGHLLGLVSVNHDISQHARTEAALRESENKYRTLFELASHAILMVRSPDGDIVDANVAAQQLLGYTKAELKQRNGFQIVAPDVAEETSRKWHLQVEQQGYFRLETIWVRQDGSRVPVTVSGKPLEIGGQTYLQLIGHDISERKRAEKIVQEQRTLTETLRETISILTSSLETDRVMHHILDNVGRIVPHSMANIMIIEGTAARISHCRGYEPQVETAIRATTYPLALRPLSHMLSTKEPYCINDVASCADWDVEFNLVSQSYLGVPILSKGRAIGFINLASDMLNAFNEVQIERLKIFAEQAAIAMQNARMYDSINQIAEELSKIQRATSLLFTSFANVQTLNTVGVQIAEATVSAFGLVDAGVILIDAAQDQLTRLDRSAPHLPGTLQPLYIDGPGLVPAALRQKQTLYVPDVSKEPRYVATFAETRSELVLPLFSGGEIIGVLDIQSPQLNAFTTSDQRALSAFAERAAVTIENIRLYTAKRQQASELQQRVAERTAQLQRMNERLTTILHNTSDAIVLLDADYRIRNTNFSFDRVFGYERDALFDQPIDLLVDKAARNQVFQKLEAAKTTNHPQRLEVPMRRKDGYTFETDMAIAFVEEEELVVCSIHDITHLKEVERIKDRFVSMVSHELRTPISSIMLSSGTLKKYYDRLSDEQKRRKLEQISQQAERLTELVTAILDISRFDARRGINNSDTADVARALEEVVTELAAQAEAKHQRVDMMVFNSKMVVMGEYADIASVWRNLLSNAIKYTNNGGRVKVTLYGGCPRNAHPCNWPDLTAFAEAVPDDLNSDHYLIGIVEDNGHGIRPEDVGQIFTRFFRGWASGTNIMGTGLGLALVRDILQLYGGNIIVNSELDVGTTLCFWLPVE